MVKTIYKGYKYRIYPDENQAIKLDQTFGCVRFLWNHLVGNFYNYGKPEYFDKFDLVSFKKREEFCWMQDVSAMALVAKLEDFKNFKKRYFNKNTKNKVGKPSFKRKSGRQSYLLSGKRRFRIDEGKSLLRLEKIGWVSIKMDRKIPENADYRSVTVSKTPSGKYYVSILVKEDVEDLPLTDKKVGIDLGLKDLFIFSNGDVVSNPRWHRENQAKLAKAQRHLSRKKRGSNRYEKQRLKVAKIHEKIANQRNHFTHNISTALVREFDVICVEDLNVVGMKKGNLAKSVSDAGWSEFVRQLSYKCDWYGKSLVKIDRFYPSTQICSGCGHKDGKKTLDIREWICSNCNTQHDRDFNAATNILVKGYSDLTGLSVNESSAELVDYKRGEDVRLGDKIDHHLAASVKRLEPPGVN